jgi:hypothetical protein
MTDNGIRQKIDEQSSLMVIYATLFETLLGLGNKFGVRNALTTALLRHGLSH